jgi:hypothetical protein
MLNFIKCFERVLIKIILDLFSDRTLNGQFFKHNTFIF